jgi:6-pyruvoyltetrahydropterin/6-carboxytetrahydropterin synthase
MHGHNYVAFFEASCKCLDNIGRVIDFSVLKEKIGGWIDTNWDHGFLYWEQDSEMFCAMRAVANQKSYMMPHNPTAENMARYLLEEICPLLLADTGVTVTKVTIHETENCYAEATKEGAHGKETTILSTDRAHTAGHQSGSSQLS